VIHGALTDTAGEVDFYTDNGFIGGLANSLFAENFDEGGSTRVRVPSVKLSCHVTDEVDFVKLDVEGAEGAVIADLVEHDKLRYVRRLTLEYHHHSPDSQDRLGVLLGMLEGQGMGYQIQAPVVQRTSPCSRQYFIISAYAKN